MDCHPGNLTTSSFPVTCVEKCLVDSRLCPGISHCTQVSRYFVVGCYSSEEICVFIMVCLTGGERR